MSSQDWQNYINENGDFEFPKYLYRTIKDLMKITLDLGTLACQDQTKLRAYKERVKSSYKAKWMDIAESLEAFGIIDPCVCRNDEYCSICGGSRFLLNDALNADEIREFAIVFGAEEHAELAEKLKNGLLKALIDTGNIKGED